MKFGKYDKAPGRDLGPEEAKAIIEMEIKGFEEKFLGQLDDWTTRLEVQINETEDSSSTKLHCDGFIAEFKSVSQYWFDNLEQLQNQYQPLYEGQFQALFASLDKNLALDAEILHACEFTPQDLFKFLSNLRENLALRRLNYIWDEKEVRSFFAMRPVFDFCFLSSFGLLLYLYHIMNKYERVPEYILDLHGFTTGEAREKLDEILEAGEYNHIRVITGKGTFRETGPVLRTFVEGYLQNHDIKFQTAKLYNGGAGALEVFLK